MVEKKPAVKTGPVLLHPYCIFRAKLRCGPGGGGGGQRMEKSNIVGGCLYVTESRVGRTI